jgi:hypothetical protein
MEEENKYIVNNETNKIVEEISKVNFQGNIIPSVWYKYIKFPSGKADLLGITILSDIIYWYRKTEIRDEKTGKLLYYKRKFKADKLQRSYSSYAEQFGVSKRQAKGAIKRLEKLGLITIEFRNITTKDGLNINNLLFLEPIPSKVIDITHQCNTYDIQMSYALHSNVIPIASECKTNTEITTEITTKNTTKEAPRFSSESEVYQLTKHLFETIKKCNNVIEKKYSSYTPKQLENLLQRWCDHIDKLIRLDNADPDDIRKVIDWVATDDFWDTVLESAKGFRKNYAKIYAKADKKNKSGKAKKYGIV